jgi:hypothetical protein
MHDNPLELGGYHQTEANPKVRIGREPSNVRDLILKICSFHQEKQDITS